MTGEQLLQHLRTRPFVPFRMHLADGRTLPVAHPELLLYIPGARTCVVANVGKKLYDTVDLLLVTSLEVGARSRDGRPRRRAR
jgi:hypothetical protein